MNDNTPVNLRERIILKAAELGGVEPDEVGANAGLDTLGLDSTDAVILAMEVEQAIGNEVEVGIFLRFETLSAAIDEIVRLYGLGDDTVPDR